MTHRNNAIYRQKLAERETLSENRYPIWREKECCPNCTGTTLQISLQSSIVPKKKRWKFACEDCKTCWYGPNWIK